MEKLSAVRNRADLVKRSEAKDKILKNQEEIRVALYVHKKALKFIDGSFGFIANLSKRHEAAVIRSRALKKLRVALFVSRAAAILIVLVRKPYKLSEKVRQAGFGIDAHNLAFLVFSRSYHRLKAHNGVEGIARQLSVSLDKGISATDRPPIPERQKVYGSNRNGEKPHKSFWTFTLDALHNITLIILIVCAIVSIVLGTAIEGWPEGMCDGLGIILCVSLVVLVTTVCHYKQYLLFQDWDEQKKKMFLLVTRDGFQQKISINDLVVGDVVHLFTGNQVPADGIYFSGYNLLIDESSLTGESELVNVNETNPFLRCGTRVQDGSGKMLVASVGMRTYWATLMATLSQCGEKATPLQEKLNGIAKFIGKIGSAFSLLTFIVLATRLMVEKTLYNEFLQWSTGDALKLLNYIAIGVTILVVGVPEGLPLAVTLSLAFATRKFINEGALVKHLSSCETMASVTSICTDKTGTLTASHMVLDRVMICDKVISSKDAADILKSAEYERALDVLLQSILQNTSSEVVQGKDGLRTIFGSPTETALLEFALLLGGDDIDRFQHFKIVQFEPFNSVRKRSSVLVAGPERGHRAFCTGAAEIILHMCSKIIHSNRTVHLSKEGRKKVMGIINGFCCGGLRTLCLAFRDVDDSSDCEIPNDNYTLIAVVGINEPVRPEVKNAVQTCLAAGIAVRMVTGDNINTAKAVAKECGILTDDGLAITGSDLGSKSPKEMKKLIPKIQVVARSSPIDKYTLVTQLKEMFGEVVAVTGDGANDAPALHAADVGLAMGIAGTEVAREIADVVLTDDNFKTIVNLVKLGRLVYRNIQQFVQFQLTINVVSLLFNFVSACISGSAPLTVVQLLWVNMISDILGALALFTEPPLDHLVERAPVGKGMKFITNVMWRNIIGQSIYQLAILLVLKFDGKRLLKLSGEDAGSVLSTVIFNSFVLCQVFNQINSQDLEKIDVFCRMLNSWLFVIVIASILALQIVIVEFLGPLAHTTPLGWRLWFVSILIGFVSMPVAALLKCIKPSADVATINPNGPQLPRRKTLKSE